MNGAMVSSPSTDGCSPKPYKSTQGTVPLPRAIGVGYEQQVQIESGHYIYKSCVENVNKTMTMIEFRMINSGNSPGCGSGPGSDSDASPGSGVQAD